MTNSDITFRVNVGIPRETVERCLTVLSMYLDDNPQDKFVFDMILSEKGWHHRGRIVRLETEV